MKNMIKVAFSVIALVLTQGVFAQIETEQPHPFEGMEPIKDVLVNSKYGGEFHRGDCKHLKKEETSRARTLLETTSSTWPSMAFLFGTTRKTC